MYIIQDLHPPECLKHNGAICHCPSLYLGKLSSIAGPGHVWKVLLTKHDLKSGRLFRRYSLPRFMSQQKHKKPWDFQLLC